jgi:SAM-dependent methyltransferase
MLEILQCPVCYDSGLRGSWTGSAFQSGSLICPSCDADFPVRDGIPDLVPSIRLEGDVWQTWQEHLERFYERRAKRRTAPKDAQVQRWIEKERAFTNFVDLPRGRVLDVGCGPGKLRHALGTKDGQYYGLDPLPAEEAADFPYVRALAEYLPFADNTFAALIVRSALDHFCELTTFYREVQRVLEPGGRIFFEQVAIQKGPVAVAKKLVHAANDLVDDFRTRKAGNDAPKHMNDFAGDDVVDSAREFFRVDEVKTYNRNWYTPTQMFVALTNE